MRIYAILQCWRFWGKHKIILAFNPCQTMRCVCVCEWDFELKTRSVKMTWTRHITSSYSHRIRNAFESFWATHNTHDSLRLFTTHSLTRRIIYDFLIWIYSLFVMLVCSVRFSFFVGDFFQSLTHLILTVDESSCMGCDMCLMCSRESASLSACLGDEMGKK